MTILQLNEIMVKHASIKYNLESFIALSLILAILTFTSFADTNLQKILKIIVFISAFILTYRYYAVKLYWQAYLFSVIALLIFLLHFIKP